MARRARGNGGQVDQAIVAGRGAHELGEVVHVPTLRWAR
jgi:hypothetical protein